MERMTGGEAIVRALRAHGVDTVFGLPGVQTYGLFDALQRDGMRVIGARHEQGCGYMAFGYARSTGKPAVFSVVPGPGILNAGAALLTCLSGNAPVVCLTGQVPGAFIGRGHGHLHEMPDQLATLRTVVKWAERIEAPAHVPQRVGRAFQQACGGRPGPVALEMPWDVFTRVGAVPHCEPLAPEAAPPPDPEALSRAARLLAAARAPMIFVGSGALNAAEEVRALAEQLQAPVVAYRTGRGIVSSAHPLGLSIAAAQRLWSDTDVAVGIGTRMEIPRWHWSDAPAGQQTIRIEIDPAQLRRAPGQINLLGDAAESLTALALELARLPQAKRERREQIAAAKAAAEREIRGVQPQMAYLDVLRSVLPETGILTDEICQAGFAAWYGFPVYAPRTFITSGFQGNLGYGLPTAIGVKVAHPDRPVVALSGDGGFMFGVAELATAVQHGIHIVVVLFNNQSFGNVRRDQREGFGGRYIGCDLVNPDFLKLAESFGIEAERVATPAAFRPALERALAEDAVRLIEVTIPRDTEASPWGFIRPMRMS